VRAGEEPAAVGVRLSEVVSAIWWRSALSRLEG
jgi:hypothetical protein